MEGSWRSWMPSFVICFFWFAVDFNGNMILFAGKKAVLKIYLLGKGLTQRIGGDGGSSSWALALNKSFIQRPPSTVSGYFGIRNCFITDTASVYSYPTNLVMNSQLFEYAPQS